MKNQITTFVCAMALTISFAFANTNDKKAETKLTLPSSTIVIDTPAPQNEKAVNQYAKYTPTQKAAIVELKVGK